MLQYKKIMHIYNNSELTMLAGAWCKHSQYMNTYNTSVESVSRCEEKKYSVYIYIYSKNTVYIYIFIYI